MSYTYFAISIEALVFSFGLVLWGIFALSPAFRKRWFSEENRLPPWRGTGLDFALMLAVIFGGGFIAQAAGQMLLSNALGKLPEHEKWTTAIVGGLLPQIGYVLGAIFFSSYLSKTNAPASDNVSGPKTGIRWMAGVCAFCLALPVVTLLSLGWGALLKLLDLPVEPQEVVDIIQATKSPVLLAIFGLLAVVGAPLMEEIVFRGTVFRAARLILPQWASLMVCVIPVLLLLHPTTGMAVITTGLSIGIAILCEKKKILTTRGLSRWAALLCSAVPFAALHQSLSSFIPLVFLGAIFAFAYEKTGSLLVAIFAHALFNFNTLFVLLSGLDLPN